MNVVLVFVHHIDSSESETYFQELNRNLARFDELDTNVFVISALRPEKLRKQRHLLGLNFFFVYDPFALSARSFGAAGRVRPHARDASFLVGKDQRIHLSGRGFTPVDQLISACEALEGRTATAKADSSEKSTGGSHGIEQEAQAAVKDIGSVDAVKMLEEKDSLFKLIDVRTQSEFDADHSAHATRIAVDEIPHRYQEIGQTDYLIFVCQAGGRSAAAAEFMVSIGAKEIYNVLGGMSSWDADRTNAAESAAD